MAKPRDPKSRAWSITWNNYTDEDLIYWKELLSEKAEQWAWQLEIAPTTGTPHIQAAVYWKSQRTFTAIQKDLPRCDLRVAEKWAKLANYCRKVDTQLQDENGNAIGDINLKKREKKPDIEIADPMENLTLKDWQIKINTLIEQPPDSRKIYWFYDLNGAVGKTTFAKHLAIRYPGRFLYLGGKANDVKSGIASFIKEGNQPDICMFDYTRSTEDYVSYEALESVKNGIFFSGKYESGMVLYNTPHVIIFANFAPRLSALSSDRWIVEDISEKIINQSQ